MNSKRSLPLILLCALVFFAFVSSLDAGVDRAEESQVFIQLPLDSREAMAQLEITPMRLVEYDSFIWMSLSADDYALLSSSDIRHTLVGDGGMVQINGYQFDPIIDGIPELPKELTADEQDEGFYLVQLIGPIQEVWFDQIEDSGFRILQYYPHFSYLVWGKSTNAKSLESLDFVRWQGLVHPAYKINGDLHERVGLIENVDIVFFNDGNVEDTLDAVSRAGGSIIQAFPSQPDKAFYDAIVTLDAAAIGEVSRIRTVLWLGHASPEPGLEDEMSSQIVAGNHPGGIPETGYFAHLVALGFDGSGVTWSTIDTGVDYAHPDLNSHIVGGYTYPGAPAGDGPGDDCAGGGHGTHVSGIIGGDASAGYTDPSGFLYGLGIAPGVGFFAQNSLCAPSWPPAGGWQEHSKQAVLGNAVGGNNSWTTGEGTQHGYQASERTHDIMVLDGNFDTTSVAEPFIEVFSAGNSGGSGLTSPKEAKNLIVTASSLNYRAGNIDLISGFSSRGPAVDGRWVPTVAAPGEDIASSRRLGSASQCVATIAGTNGYYSLCSGTSMAAPHTSGSIVLATEWWRTFNQDLDPSPAMAKALIVNGAVDMGTPDIPNINEGWGRINVTNIISPGVSMVYRDQLDLFSNSGEQFQLSIGIADPTRPLKVTLAWSDAPGAVGANPALVNNLNLTVENGGNTFLGNVFGGGWSTTGGSADAINNLENVYIQNPSGSATITVDAVNIAGDAVLYNGDPTDQSFALVCYNCALYPDFSIDATPDASSVCVPDDALYDVDIQSILGYVDPVSLSAVGNPVGTTADFSVNPVYPPGSSVLTISNTAAGAAGSYDIDIVGMAPTSTHTTTVRLDLFATAPSEPVPLFPADGATNVSLIPDFSWNPSGTNEAAYLIEVATDPAFTNIIFTALVEETSVAPSSPLDPLTPYYWRVQAANPCGSSPWSATFTFITADIPPILLVDDDDNSPDVRPTYLAALDILVGPDSYDVWDTNNSDNEPDAQELSVYDAVIWFTGDEFGGYAGPGTDGETALGTWLDTGGCLLLNSQDYHWDRDLTPFMQNYLGVLSVTDDLDQLTVNGQGSVFGSLGPYTLSFPFTNYSDVVNPDGSAEVAFSSASPGNAGVYKETANYKTTFWGFPWEAIPTAADREDVLTAFFGWCGEGFEPSIFVSPSSIDEIAYQNTSIDNNLTIGNSGSADLEWTIQESSSGNCGSPSDIPWVHLSLSSGTTPPGSTTDIVVTFQATNHPPGFNSGALCVASNDSLIPMVSLPVSMEVIPYQQWLPALANQD